MTVWFIARGAGLSALVLLSAATCLGALVSRPAEPGRRFVVQYLHRACAGLGIAVLALHLTTILADPFADVGWRGALLPFTSGYRASWVAFGTIAAYLFAGVALLGLARGRMARTPTGARVWRGLHGLAYAGWATAMVHGFFTGTDSTVGWVRALYVTCLLAVLGSLAYRVAPLVAGRRAAAGYPCPDRFAGRPAPASATGLRPVEPGRPLSGGAVR